MLVDSKVLALLNDRAGRGIPTKLGKTLGAEKH